MEPYERSELGGVLSTAPEPLTQLRHRQQTAKSAQPSPLGRGKNLTQRSASTPSPLVAMLLRKSREIPGLTGISRSGR
jgi:hypothetical protein